MDFNWETVTESGNAGFNIYVVIDRNEVLLTPQMIPSQVIDSISPVSYGYQTVTEGARFFIEMINVTGGTERFGPFDLGEEYGSSSFAPTNSQLIFLPLIAK